MSGCTETEAALRRTLAMWVEVSEPALGHVEDGKGVRRGQAMTTG